MAICDLCKEEMTAGASCVVDAVEIRSRRWTFAPFGSERGWPKPRPGELCPDCGVRAGGMHHVGCDLQTCPACGGQFISCGCWEEVDDDGNVVDEAHEPPLYAGVQRVA